jgi:hypothetical protein
MEFTKENIDNFVYTMEQGLKYNKKNLQNEIIQLENQNYNSEESRNLIEEMKDTLKEFNNITDKNIDDDFIEMFKGDTSAILHQLPQLYQSHFDLFMSNFEDKFTEYILNDLTFGNFYINSKNFIETLNYHSNMSFNFTQLVSKKKMTEQMISQYDLTNEKKTSPTKLFLKEIVGMDLTPKESIFHRLKCPPIEFANSLHRIYVKLYILMKTREIQYVAADTTNRKFTGYNMYLRNLMTNLSSKLEYEIELYCEQDCLTLLAKHFQVVIDRLLELGNIPLVEFIKIMFGRFKNCNSRFSDTLERYRDTRSRKIFAFLLDPFTFTRKFMDVYEAAPEDRVEIFSKLYSVVHKTRIEIIKQSAGDSIIPNIFDIVVYEYLQVNNFIPFVSRKGDIKCLIEKCGN